MRWSLPNMVFFAHMILMDSDAGLPIAWAEPISRKKEA